MNLVYRLLAILFHYIAIFLFVFLFTTKLHAIVLGSYQWRIKDSLIRGSKFLRGSNYCTYPKFLETETCLSSVDADQTHLIRVYIVCHSSSNLDTLTGSKIRRTVYPLNTDNRYNDKVRFFFFFFLV